jgi:hypothetical protein
MFTASQRQHNVYFSYPWSEADQVDIELPAGYDLESPGGRQPISMGDAGKYQFEILVSQDHRWLRCVRSLVFGSNNSIMVAASKYPLLKQLFDAIHEIDNHTLTLLQTAAHQ